MGRLHEESHTHKVDELLTANRNTSWILRQRQIYGRQARIIAKHHKDRWTKLVSNWNRARSTKQEGHRKQGRQVDDINTYLQTYSSNGEQRHHERHNLAYRNERHFEMGCIGQRHHKQQTQTTSTTHDFYQQDYDHRTSHTRENNVRDSHDQNEDDTKDDDFSLIFFQLIDS